MARNSRRSSAAVSRREREPEQQSRTEKSGARTSRAGQSNREQGSRGKATVHEFPRKQAVGRREPAVGGRKQSGARSPESAQRGGSEEQPRLKREIKSRFAGNGKAAQQGWAEQKSKSRAAQQAEDQQQK